MCARSRESAAAARARLRLDAGIAYVSRVTVTGRFGVPSRIGIDGAFDGDVARRDECERSGASGRVPESERPGGAEMEIVDDEYADRIATDWRADRKARNRDAC